jgi:hypothetical protein
VAAGCAGLAASATALTQFIHVNLVWGNGPRPPDSGNWWLGRTGSTPGTSTEAASMSAGGGLDWAYVINTRDFPPQTPLPLPSLATTRQHHRSHAVALKLPASRRDATQCRGRR